MDVQVAVLADYANIAAGNKLNVMGIFDTLAATVFPTVQPFMVLALRLRLAYEDGSRVHELAVSLRDEDGREYLRAAAKVNVPRIEPGLFQNVNQVLNFAGMGFAKPGTYACGFTSSEPLKTAQGWDVPLRYHPEHPDLNVVLFPTERVHIAVTLHVVRIIDTLTARLAQSGAHGSTTA